MKLYSELAERENRFFLSLEISFPFVLVIALLAYLLNSIDFEWQDRILFVILTFCYIYYVVYLIYYGFNSTLLDDKSGAFSRDEIIKIISKEIHKPNQNVVLLNISNLQDISQRYGHKNGDKIVRNFILEFNKFFGENGFDRIKIGRYFGANFLFITDCKISQLEHLLKSFECQIVNRGINNIEVKMKFAVNKNLYDKNIENTTTVEESSNINRVRFTDLEINLTNYSVTYNDKRVDMPPKELELFYFLASHPNQVFTREQLLDRIWGYEYIGDTRTVDVHVKRLRQKINDHAEWRLSTVWGVGYKFETLTRS